MNRRYFITGIGTSVGKTIASAALVKFWGTSYWKPIQSGDLENSDSQIIRNLAGREVVIYPEQFKLNTAASPHYSAEIDQVRINLNDFKIPLQRGDLIVEGAGGVFVPINENEFIIDLIEYLNLPVILVCSDYLGSINHSLMTFQVLQQRGIEVSYILLNGDFKDSTKRILLKNKPEGSRVIMLSKLEELSSNGLSAALKNIIIEN